MLVVCHVLYGPQTKRKQPNCVGKCPEQLNCMGKCSGAEVRHCDADQCQGAGSPTPACTALLRIAQAGKAQHRMAPEGSQWWPCPGDLPAAITKGEHQTLLLNLVG